MKYQIRQKIFTFADNFTIKDDEDRDQFIVRGRFFTIGDKLSIEDLEGNELAYIEQKIFRFLPEYNIYRGGKQLANVKKEFTLFKSRFNIQSTMGSYTMEGNIWAHEFQILKDNKEVAWISKKWLSFSDTYLAEIDDKEDQAFMLALVIVIDQVLHDNRKNNNN